MGNGCYQLCNLSFNWAGIEPAIFRFNPHFSIIEVLTTDRSEIWIVKVLSLHILHNFGEGRKLVLDCIFEEEEKHTQILL